MGIEMFEFILILTLISLNGFFALAELAVLSAKKLRLQELANDDDRAGAALDLIERPNRFLSTVQIGITLVGVASGAIGGATMARILARLIKDLPVIGQYAESIGVFLVILVITYLSLVIGELVPKQLALSNPERYAMGVAPIMKKLTKWLLPASRLLSVSTSFFVKLLGVDSSRKPDVSMEELRLMIDEGVIMGVLEPIEEIMLEQVLRFDEARIEALVTPRPEIAWLDIKATQEEIKDFVSNYRHEKIPVADEDLDRILGMVYSHELLVQLLQNGSFDLEAALNPAVLAPEGFDILQTLELMQKERTDIVFVLNEFGGVDGMVTSKDVLEAIVGDLPEPDESYDPKIVKRADGSMLLDGKLLLDVFSELIQMDLDDLRSSQVQTLAGFVITQLGAIPHTGDQFEVYGYSFEIIDMDGNRVDKVLVQKLTDEEIASEENLE